MKVLSFDQFVEKLKINAVDAKSFDKLKIPNIHIGSASNNPDDWYERMRDKEQTTYQFDILTKARKCNHFKYDGKRFDQAINDTNERFYGWKKLSDYDLYKKHDQRAHNDRLTPEKKLACYEVALKWYGPTAYKYRPDKERRKIIEYYHDMLLKEGYTDDELYNIFIK